MRTVLRTIYLLNLLAIASVGPIAAGGTPEGGVPFEDRFHEMTWDDIVAEAEGQTVYWYMWGGSDATNSFVTGYVAGRLAEEYGINLEMVPVTDAVIYVNKVLGEKQAGRNSGGSVDLVWINGENFRTMREADLLFGPYAETLPNIQYVDTDAPAVANDFGYPVDGYESPYGSAQVVMIYDSAKIGQPPRTVDALLQWIQRNPGRFTYPVLPDFTGSAFVRHIFYHAAGGYRELLGPFNEEQFDDVAPKTWKILNEIEPYLWREGRTYPENRAQLQELFSNGEVSFDISYNPAGAATLVSQGRYPESTRTFVFEEGTIGNTHYVAIPYNSPHKAAAMVTANLLLDPETQLEKAKPDVWGDLTVLSIDRLPEEWQERFADLPRPPQVLPLETLENHKIPELQATWLEAIEMGWMQHVLRN